MLFQANSISILLKVNNVQGYSEKRKMCWGRFALRCHWIWLIRNSDQLKRAGVFQKGKRHQDGDLNLHITQVYSLSGWKNLHAKPCGSIAALSFFSFPLFWIRLLYPLYPLNCLYKQLQSAERYKDLYPLHLAKSLHCIVDFLIQKQTAHLWVEEESGLLHQYAPLIFCRLRGLWLSYSMGLWLNIKMLLFSSQDPGPPPALGSGVVTTASTTTVEPLILVQNYKQHFISNLQYSMDFSATA